MSAADSDSPYEVVRPAARLAAIQGAYFLGTGLWPLLHMRSFEAFTGPKLDRWLVKTVGLLVASIGGVLLGAARRKQVPPELRTLAVTSAASLAAIDCVYVLRGRIAPVYFLDAAGELLLVAGWLRTGRGRRERRHPV